MRELMFSFTIANRILFVSVLVFGFSLSVKAQEDCIYGFRIYARDAAGMTIENAKLEVLALGTSEKLPANVNFYVEKSGVYNIHGSGWKTIKGKFLLKISAEGFEAYERQVNFPICEVQKF